MTPHPMKHYEDMRRAWKRLHQVSGDVCQAFDEGDLKAMEIGVQLAAESLQDIVDATTRFSKAAKKLENGT